MNQSLKDHLHVNGKHYGYALAIILAGLSWAYSQIHREPDTIINTPKVVDELPKFK